MQKVVGSNPISRFPSNPCACDLFGIRSTSLWTGAAITVQFPRTTHRHATETLAQADALLLGRATYELMESAWRPPGQMDAMPDWMAPFGRTIDAMKKYVVSSTLERVDWNAELVRGISGRQFRS